MKAHTHTHFHLISLLCRNYCRFCESSKENICENGITFLMSNHWCQSRKSTNWSSSFLS